MITPAHRERLIAASAITWTAAVILSGLFSALATILVWPIWLYLVVTPTLILVPATFSVFVIRSMKPSADGHADDGTEVRECECGREFEVVVKYARPWTVCPTCVLG